LNPSSDFPVSKFAFKFNLCRYSVAFASGFDERELLDSLSCLLARAFLGQGKPKEALQGLNPALMQARREGGPGAVKPHSLAAEAFKALGDHDKMRVELRALMEAAAEGNDEAEQGAALLLAGCLLHDVGDVAAAVPLLSSAAAAGEKLRDFGMRAGARNRAGAALLRMRRPQQALEAWADELKALEDAEKAEAAEKEAAEAAAAEAAREVEALEVSATSDEKANKAKAAAAAAASASQQKLKPKPLGDTRSRRCQAHGNMFMAHLLLGPGGRPAAEAHLQHALSLARQLTPAAAAEEQEARVWVQAGNAHHLASAEGGGEEAERAYTKALELAKKAGADDLVAAAERGLAKDIDVAALLK
jgi:tetratricopeptide (TPR) repeat protein